MSDYDEEEYTGPDYGDEGYADDGNVGYGGDGVTDVETEGYFERLGASCAGICIGVALFFGAFPLLWWNEGRAVDMYKAINEGRNIYVPIDANKIDSANEGKLVYLTGFAEANENITDDDFGVDALNGAIALSRKVDMYQWVESSTKEKKKNLGGSTTTTTRYTYSKDWRDKLVDSSRFRDSNYVNKNPSSMPYMSESFYSTVILGSFTLPDSLVTSMVEYESLGMDYNTTMLPSTNTLAQSMKERADTTGFYFSKSPNATATSAAVVGDTRVSYNTAYGGDVSILAKQFGSTFEAFTATSGANLFRLETGISSAESMFNNAESENKMLAWILRIVGMICMSVGIGLCLQPLSVAADLVPCLGSYVGGAISCVAGLIGVVLSLIVIGIAWVAQRPIFLGIAVGGLVVVGGLVAYGLSNRKSNKDAD
jgi:hypothetical protein